MEKRINKRIRKRRRRRGRKRTGEGEDVLIREGGELEVELEEVEGGKFV